MALSSISCHGIPRLPLGMTEFLDALSGDDICGVSATGGLSSDWMKLYFLRHGQADWPEWDKPDDERPLTKKGKKQMRHVAKMLCELKASPAIVLTSPFPRAQQTADIAAKHLCVDVREERALGKGFSAAKLREILKRNKVDELMLVGHEPDFSAVIRAVTGGEVKLSKAGVALVDLEEGADAGRLVWLLPPKLAKL